MTALTTEKRLLQATVALACLVPLSAGLAGALIGPVFVGARTPSADLDSHLRYLSGLLLAIGLGFATCLPTIERKGDRMRLLGSLVVVGGFARAYGVAVQGWPSTGHRFGLAMELVVVPCLVAWQAGFARRWERSVPPSTSPRT